MNRSALFVCAAALLGLASAPLATAQQNISVYSGNGQLICNQCASLNQIPGVNSVLLSQYTALSVKVTDNGGAPAQNASVIWSVASGSQYLQPNSTTTTVTDSTGLSHNTFLALPQNAALGPVQSQITATLADNNSVTFTLTQTSPDAFGNQHIVLDAFGNPSGTVPPLQTAFSGNAGSSGTPFTIGVLSTGTATQPTVPQPLAGVSIRLINLTQTNGAGAPATVACAQGAGADPASVITDSTGYATCTPVFSGAGSGQFAILVGGQVLTSSTYPDGTPVPQQPPYVGVYPTTDPNAPQPTWAAYSYLNGFYNLQVTPAAVGSVTAVSGNNQSANSGSALATPLVGSVTTTAGSPVANQAVTWTVTPAGAATLSSTGNATDVSGHVSTNVTLSSSASGTVTVTLAAGGKSFNFTITAIIPTHVSGITKLSGDTQTAIEGAAFANPLAVQVSVSGGTAAGLTVTWAVSPASGATLSAFTTATDGNGQAKITVTAGSTAGAITVTATTGSFSTTFNLTISPPGPSLTANSFVNGADFQVGSISPCSIATAIAPGIAPGISGVVLGYNIVGYLNYTVANVSVTVGGAQSPIYNVANLPNGQQQVTFQVPCSVTPGSSVPVTVAVGGGSATINVRVLPASPGVFQEQSTVTVAGYGPLPLAVVAKRDGTLVSPTNPARVGETVIAYVTGLGPTNPAVATNALPAFGVAAGATGTVIVGVNNAGVPVTFAQLSQDLIGVSLVAFTVPALPSGSNGNLVFSIGLIPSGSSTPYYSNPAAIYIQ